MKSSDRKFLKPGCRVVCNVFYPRSSYYVATPGSLYSPYRTESCDIQLGWTGTFMRSSPDSGPAYKIVKWDENGIESEIHFASIDFI